MSTHEASSQRPADEKREMLRRLLEKKAARPEMEFPLSHGQNALWFLYQFDPDSAAYNVVFAARARSTLNIPALRKALQQLTNRHRALRTTFQNRDGKPIQVVHTRRAVALTEVDASGWTEAELHEQASAEANRPFDLEAGPLFRGTIFSRADDDHVMVFAIHHIIGDFWSLNLMMADVGRLYLPDPSTPPVKLPHPSVQYADYLRWQEAMLKGPEGEALWDYWERNLEGELPFLNLPTDRRFPDEQTTPGAAISFPIDDQLSARLRQLAQGEDVTLFTVLLAAYQVLLHRYSRQNDILVGSPAAGRSRQELEQIVGYLTNMVVFRAKMPGNPRFHDFLQQVRETVIDGLNHQDYPFSLLVGKLDPFRDPRRPPIYQAAFLMERSQFLGTQSTAAMIIGQEGTRFELNGIVLEPYGAAAGGHAVRNQFNRRRLWPTARRLRPIQHRSV